MGFLFWLLLWLKEYKDDYEVEEDDYVDQSRFEVNVYSLLTEGELSWVTNVKMGGNPLSPLCGER